MNKTPWYWEDTAMLLLISAILVFFLNVGMWLGTLDNQEQQPWMPPRPPWYVSMLVTLITIIIPVILFAKYAEMNENQ